MTDLDASETKPLFSVLCQPNDDPGLLFLRELTFSRLLDDVVVPFETNKPFFVDGVPLTKDKIRRLKIIQESDFFASEFSHIHNDVRTRQGKELEAAAATYDTRLSALFLETGEDVTSQVLKAFNSEVKPKLRDYISKRPELISAALRAFLEAVKMLGT
jgi:hypothetical protein